MLITSVIDTLITKLQVAADFKRVLRSYGPTNVPRHLSIYEKELSDICTARSGEIRSLALKLRAVYVRQIKQEFYYA